MRRSSAATPAGLAPRVWGMGLGGPARGAGARGGARPPPPPPLGHAPRRDRASEDRVQGLFVPDYQGSAIWTSLGSIYLALLRRLDPPTAAAGLAGYARLGEGGATPRGGVTDDPP